MPKVTIEYDNGTKISFDVDVVSIRVDGEGDLHLDTNFSVEGFSKRIVQEANRL